MKAEELRDLSEDDLHAKVNELKESLFRMRFKLSLGNTDVVNQLRDSRKDLARVKTLLRQRELAATNTPPVNSGLNAKNASISESVASS